MATFTSMQEIVSKNNIGRRYTRFVSRGKCALLRDNTLLCGRRAGYVMVVGRFEKLIHTSELRIKPLSAISYIIVYIYISNGDISLFIYAHWAFSLFIGEGLRKKRSIFNDSLSMCERNFLDHAYERSSPRSLLMNGETRVRVNSREKRSVDARDSWMELIFLKLYYITILREKERTIPIGRNDDIYFSRVRFS